MEIFYVERVKINIRVRKLLRTPAVELSAILLAISPLDVDKTMKIFWQVLETYPEDQRNNLLKVCSVFPAFLSVLDGNYSDNRVEYVAKFLLGEIHNSQKNIPKPD